MPLQRLVFLFLLLVTISACDKPKPKQEDLPQQEIIIDQRKASLPNTEQTQPEITQSSFNPFYIYADKGSRENHFVPSGFMPNGKCLKLDAAWKDECYQGKTCIRVDYDIECSRTDQEWAGIYWLNPANNWGRLKGGFNLNGAAKLTFWAKGKNGGEQIQEFTIGGIEGDYPDSDKIIMGPVILSNQWKKYTVDLRGKDLSYISGGFAWSTGVDVNSETCVFYLDEIRYE